MGVGGGEQGPSRVGKVKNYKKVGGELGLCDSHPGLLTGTH